MNEAIEEFRNRLQVGNRVKITKSIISDDRKKTKKVTVGRVVHKSRYVFVVELGTGAKTTYRYGEYQNIEILGR